MTSSGVLYAIRHKPTGFYLPRGRGRGGRGATHQEPEPLSVDTRLFTSEKGAGSALTWWLDGKTSVTFSDYDSDEAWHTEPVKSRNRGDMEIVTMCLTPVCQIKETNLNAD